MNEIEDTMSFISKEYPRKRTSVDQPSMPVFKKQIRHTESQNIVNTSDTTKLASNIRGTKQNDRSSEVVSEGKCYLLAKTSAQWKDQDSPKAEKHNYVPSVTKISNVVKEEAAPVLSLTDKKFSGEVNQTSEIITFRPSGGWEVHCRLNLNTSFKIITGKLGKSGFLPSNLSSSDYFKSGR